MTTDEQGKEYQDYLSELLHIPFYSSKKYQNTKGESPHPFGIETKRNSKAHEIGCWIEIAEKRKSENKKWIITDWVTNPKCFFILAGNEQITWLFAKKSLLTLALKKDFKIIDGETSIGFHLSIKECNQGCRLKIEMDEIKNINDQLTILTINKIKERYPEEDFLTIKELENILANKIENEVCLDDDLPF